ncbi:uncharacterized protein LOC109813199 [Cajanus cajan]|uniref:uncharacterized protein LOC109813199 n=1 Tax=Cajanus cajan TaxID=3821 RepID=UPI00098DD2C5|nr:uncharacterized protein LOC109813199 [Cajanus cajan]XP_020232932.1 uncharacterized protein LOC109813199 [Cajanus cajan]
MASESNGFGQQRSSANTSGLRVLGFSRRIGSFINNNNEENSQVFTDAWIRDHFSQILYCFNNLKNGLQDFTRATIYSLRIGDSFNNLENGLQDFTRAEIESLGIRDSFNNGGSGSQVFKDGLIRCANRTHGIHNFFNHAGNWAANLLPGSVTRSISFQNPAEFIVSLLPESVPHSGIHHSFNCPNGSQNLKGARITV